MATQPIEKSMAAPQDVYQALEGLRDALKDSKKSKGEILEIGQRCDKTLDQFEDLKSKLIAESTAKEKLYTDLTDRLIGLEKSMTRFSPKSDEYDTTKQEMAAFTKVLSYGRHNQMKALTPDEIKLLRTDDLIQGGFLAPDDFVVRILKKIVEISPVRSVASTMTIANTGGIEIPKRETLVTAKYTGQAAPKAPSNSTYGLEKLNLNGLVSVTRATTQMLTDSKFDIENQASLDVAEAMAQNQGEAFVRGDSVEKPEGFMFNTSVPEINSGIANDISGDALIALTGSLASGQRPVFAFNRRTRAAIRSLKDSSGAYLFQLDVGLGAALSTTVVGFPFIEMIDMDDIAVDSFPIIFGDFNRGYLIIDGASLTLKRDDLSEAESNIIKFVWTMFNGGQVVLADAFVKMKVAV